MKYFLDSAKINEIIYARDNWPISGVTTNPKHIKNGGVPFDEFLNEISALVRGEPEFDVLVEINPHLETKDEMTAAAEKLARVCENFVIKIPCCEQGLSAAYALENKGIRTASTLIFSPAQAVAAASAGVKYAAPFMGWLDDAGGSGAGLIGEIMKIYKNNGYETKVIAASIRSPRAIAEAAAAGCDAVTAGYDIISKSFDHPLTSRGLEQFRGFWDGTDTGEW